MDSTYIDIHSHLNDKRFDADLSETLQRMREAHVSTIVVGTDMNMSKRAVEIAEEHPDIWATIGLHPNDNRNEDFDTAAYEKLAAHPRVVAIGECGLDYYYFEKLLGNKDAEADRQQELFETQMHLAVSVDKPLVIHGRPTKGTMDAYEDILHILKNGQKKYGEKIRGDVHFFVGDTAIAKQFLDIGFSMSFTGVATFTHDYDAVIQYIPLDRLMAETDAPYVAPTPYRGHRNEPTYVVEVYRALASVRGVEIEVLQKAFLQNAKNLFNLK